jgi:hypothetical protein
MCYQVYISTDSSKDLAQYNTDFLRLKEVTDPLSDPCISLLEFPRRWYVGSQSGCSCTFRHLMSIELGFSEPVDWYKEKPEELKATLELYFVLESVLALGNQVDLMDRWEGSEPDDITTIDVFLDDVVPQAFRLFEDYKFRITKKKTKQLNPYD